MAKHGKTPYSAKTDSEASATVASSGRYKRHTPGNQAKTIDREIYDLKFDILRSALYHGAREHWMNTWHRGAIGAGLLAGASAVTATLSGAPKVLILTVGIIVTTVTIFDLVFDWSGVAILHARMRERFFGLLAEIEQCKNPETEVRRFRARLAESYQQEPPVYHALNEIMWNRAYDALSENFNAENCRKVTGWRRFFAHLIPQRGHNFN